MSRVDLGFLEKADLRLLKSNFFPSKIGGKPAWLNLEDLPTPEDLQCKVCKHPMIFLCQVYATVEDKETCFHRTLFLFICRNSACCSPNTNDNIAVFRSQLKKYNDFYSPEPPNEELEDSFEIGKHVKLCEVCGSFAFKHCSKCKITPYCSREHQISDWKNGHKKTCGTSIQAANKLLFEEWDLVVEEESEPEPAKTDEKKQLDEFKQLVAEGKAGTMPDASEEDLQSHAAADEDKTFARFRSRIAANPNQVLRYDRGGSPLWISAQPCPEVPACEFCNSPRQFEFQLMPQLLYSLHENEIDWGTIVVYTCKDYCDGGPSYKKEYVFKQDITK